MGSKKQLQREMHRSVKANGQVSLPHFPVSTVWWGRQMFSAVLSLEEKGWEVEGGRSRVRGGAGSGGDPPGEGEGRSQARGVTCFLEV